MFAITEEIQVFIDEMVASGAIIDHSLEKGIILRDAKIYISDPEDPEVSLLGNCVFIKIKAEEIVIEAGKYHRNKLPYLIKTMSELEKKVFWLAAKDALKGSETYTNFAHGILNKSKINLSNIQDEQKKSFIINHAIQVEELNDYLILNGHKEWLNELCLFPHQALKLILTYVKNSMILLKCISSLKPPRDYLSLKDINVEFLKILIQNAPATVALLGKLSALRYQDPFATLLSAANENHSSSQYHQKIECLLKNKEEALKWLTALKKLKYKDPWNTLVYNLSVDEIISLFDKNYEWLSLTILLKYCGEEDPLNSLLNMDTKIFLTLNKNADSVDMLLKFMVRHGYQNPLKTLINIDFATFILLCTHGSAVCKIMTAFYSTKNDNPLASLLNFSLGELIILFNTPSEYVQKILTAQELFPKPQLQCLEIEKSSIQENQHSFFSKDPGLFEQINQFKQDSSLNHKID